MGTEIELFEIRPQFSLDFCLWCWMKSEVYKLKVVTRDELPVRILDAADSTKGREDQPRRTTRDLRSRVAKCAEADDGIFEHLLSPVTNLSYTH